MKYEQATHGVQASCLQHTQSVHTEYEHEKKLQEQNKDRKECKYKTQFLQTEEYSFSTNEVKCHINDVVHQLELTLVNSLTRNTSGIETENLKLELQTAKDEKQKIKNEIKLIRQQLQDEKDKRAKSEMERRNLQNELERIKDDNKQNKEKCKNLKSRIETENEQNKEKRKDLKQQIQIEKDKNAKLEQQLQSLEVLNRINDRHDNGNMPQRKQFPEMVQSNASNNPDINGRHETGNMPQREQFPEMVQSNASNNPVINGRHENGNIPQRKQSTEVVQSNASNDPDTDEEKVILLHDEEKVLLFGNSHLTPIIAENFIKSYATEKHICFTTEEGISFLKDSQDTYKCIFLHFITNDVKKKSPNSCVNDFAKLIETCEDKWPSAKVIISTGLPRGDYKSLNEKVQICNAKLQGLYIETDNVSFCDNSSLGIRGEPNMRLFNSDRVHLSDNGIRVLAANMKVSIAKALNIQRFASEPSQGGFRRGFNNNFGHARGSGRGMRPRG